MPLSCLQLPCHSHVDMDTTLDGITSVITRNVRASEALTYLPFNRCLEKLHIGGRSTVFPGPIVLVPSLLYRYVYGCIISRYSVDTFQDRTYGLAAGIGARRSYAGGRGGEWCADWRNESEGELDLFIFPPTGSKKGAGGRSPVVGSDANDVVDRDGEGEGDGLSLAVVEK